MSLQRSMLLLAFAATAACGQTSSESAGGQDQRPSEAGPPLASGEETEAAQVDSLAGEWRVAAIDGDSVDEPVALTLSGDDQSIWWEPKCAGVVRRYQIQGRSIAFSPNDPPSPEKSSKVVCSIGLPPRLDDVTRALDGAESIARTANNGVLISGPDHSATLFSQ